LTRVLNRRGGSRRRDGEIHPLPIVDVAGGRCKPVQAVLGHESVNTTFGYLTSSPEDLRRAVEREADED
jgi:integrase